MKKTILITGAGTGIGKDTALALTRRGHRVIATTETEAQSRLLAEQCHVLQLPIIIFKLDITSETDRKKIEDHQLDVLINNAGIGESGSLAELDLNRLRHNFEVNVFSTFQISQLALKKMVEKKRGTLLFTSSLAGRMTIPFLSPYCMTKFAISAGAEALRNELHRVYKDIHVSIIEPGGYHTGFNQKNMAKKYTWMNERSFFYPIIPQIKAEEERKFRLTESKNTSSIVRKIVKAVEAERPKLRYSAPWWQAFGIQLLRIAGK